MDLEDIKLTVGPYLNKLAAFDTHLEIRDFLAAEGVKAVRGRSMSCAIAKYVYQGSGQEVMVGRSMTEAPVGHGDDVHVYSVLNRKDQRMIVCAKTVGEHTPAMTDFVRYFDQGRYPELEA